MLKKTASTVLVSLRGFVKREARYERRFTVNDARHSLGPCLGQGASREIDCEEIGGRAGEIDAAVGRVRRLVFLNILVSRVSFTGCVVVLMMSGLLTVGCQRSAETTRGGRDAVQTLHYFTWSDYAGPELIESFEKEAGVKVVVDTFSSNEELLAKLQSGATGYDVVVPSDFMVAIMIGQGLLAELDLVKIPNAQLLADNLRQLPFDPTLRYSVPYLWGTVGIGYDSTVFPTPPDSWSVLWDPRYKGKISMLNDQREVFGAVLRSMGQSLNTRDPSMIERAKEQLIRQKHLVKTYTSEHYDQLLASGEVVLAHGWGGPVARATAERPSIEFTVPREGGTVWADCLVVLKTSPEKDLAMRFINYLLDSSVAAKTSERLLFASANREARGLVRVQVRENPAIYPPDTLFPRLEWMTDVGDAIRVYDRAWTELKMY